MKIYLSGTRIYQWLLASTKKDLTLYKNTISNAEVQRTSLLHKNKSKTNWFPMICRTGPACGWRKTWSMKREICLNQQQSFLMLAMVLLTFWGARKASLCLTDFFIASQHQIFFMLAIFLPNSEGEEMPLCSWLIPSQQEKGRHKEFFLASIRTSFPLWGFCSPFWRNRNASHYLRAFILRITLKQKTCFSFLLAG